MSARCMTLLRVKSFGDNRGVEAVLACINVPRISPVEVHQIQPLTPSISQDMTARFDHRDDDANTASAIPLRRMTQQLEVRRREDDWTGVTSTAARRKLQNRLNQRAYRKRISHLSKHSETVESDCLEPVALPHSPAAAMLPFTGDEQPVAQLLLINSAACAKPHQGLEKTAIVRALAARAYDKYVRGTPCQADLPTLIQVNVNQALARNNAALGFSNGWLLCEAVSPFGIIGPSQAFLTLPPQSSCPESLRPTVLQESIPHHPWIDLFPLPQLRDNILIATADPTVCDEDELCWDLVEIWGPNEKPALIVWGEPWDPRGWEASPAFLRKWGWLLTGCTEILEATNYWREKRGERRLSFA